jgi:serine/threonine protein kinase
VETNTVYKRITWSKNAERPDLVLQHGQLQAFVNEIRVLGPLKSSPNIIDLVGIAWEQDAQAQLNPVLALEYAQHNSLARFLAENGSTITFKTSLVEFTISTKKTLCGGIANPKMF